MQFIFYRFRGIQCNNEEHKPSLVVVSQFMTLDRSCLIQFAWHVDCVVTCVKNSLE